MGERWVEGVELRIGEEEGESWRLHGWGVPTTSGVDFQLSLVRVGRFVDLGCVKVGIYSRPKWVVVSLWYTRVPYFIMYPTIAKEALDCTSSFVIGTRAD